jgi:probable HAF family extracellular repeat protein
MASTLIDLGPGSAYAVNDAGQVAGDGADQHAFLYSGGIMQDLGTLGGTDSAALGINDAGQVVGESSLAETSGNFTEHAFLYSGGVMQDLGTFGGANSYATGINDAGQVAGYAQLADGSEHAFLYSNGIMLDLGTLGGSSSFALGIDDAGQVVGEDVFANGSRYPFLYSNGVMNIFDAASFGGIANAINNAGEVVGQEYVTLSGINNQHAFLYAGGVISDLGTLIATPEPFGSNGIAINNSGQVLVNSLDGGPTGSHLFLYSGGVLTDLSPAFTGWSHVSGAGINDSGQVVGTMFSYASGGDHGFLLDTGSSTPEPASIALFSAGTALIAVMRKRLAGTVSRRR